MRRVTYRLGYGVRHSLLVECVSLTPLIPRIWPNAPCRTAILSRFPRRSRCLAGFDHRLTSAAAPPSHPPTRMATQRQPSRRLATWRPQARGALTITRLRLAKRGRGMATWWKTTVSCRRSRPQDNNSTSSGLMTRKDSSGPPPKQPHTPARSAVPVAASSSHR